MHDPHIMIYSIYNKLFTFQLWHKDPCNKGTSDDSCGWFMRARHGDKEMLKKIEDSFAYEWDRTFEKYSCGWFHPNGDPRLSVIGITINMFQTAGVRMWGWEKAMRYTQKNLASIIHFAENNIDSLHDGITRKFEKGCSEEYTPRIREERIHSMAVCIYGWILRDTRPWYKHPRWHVHHWEVNFRMHLPKKSRKLAGVITKA